MSLQTILFSCSNTLCVSLSESLPGSGYGVERHWIHGGGFTPDCADDHSISIHPGWLNTRTLATVAAKLFLSVMYENKTGTPPVGSFCYYCYHGNWYSNTRLVAMGYLRWVHRGHHLYTVAMEMWWCHCILLVTLDSREGSGMCSAHAKDWHFRVQSRLLLQENRAISWNGYHVVHQESRIPRNFVSSQIVING